MNKIEIKQIVFTKINVAELIDMGEYDLDSIGDNEVAVKTVFSTISCGTEKANITGDPNVAGGTGRIIPFPRYLGYRSSGQVVKTGKNVTKISEGDKVIVYNGNHKNFNIVNQNQVVKVVDGVNFSNAAVCFIATFPLAALRKVQLEIGESALIMGLGILGQLGVKLARNAGAYPIIAAEPVESRRKMAIENGADYAFNPFDEDFAEKVKNSTGGGVNTACIWKILRTEYYEIIILSVIGLTGNFAFKVNKRRFFCCAFIFFVMKTFYIVVWKAFLSQSK